MRTGLVSRASAASALARAERDPGPTARIAKRIYSCRPGSRVSLRSPGHERGRSHGACDVAARAANRWPSSQFTMSNSAVFFVPAARCCARVLSSDRVRIRPEEGWAERRQAHYLCCRVCETRRSARVRRGASHDAGRSPLGAPPWRFSAGGRASISGIASGSVQRCSSACYLSHPLRRDFAVTRLRQTSARKRAGRFQPPRRRNSASPR